MSAKAVGKALALVIGGVVGGMSVSAQSEEIVARLAFHWSPTHHSAIHAQMFADEVNKRGEGKIRIDVFPSGQLFGIREILGAVTSGAVEIGGIVGIVSFPPINKNYNVVAYPGLFNSYQQQRDFLLKSEGGRAIWDDLTTKANVTHLMFDPVGPVMTFSSARELTGVAAMEGLKARALIKSERPMWDALKANTVSLPTGEVYTALQTGMIDTINSPPGSIKAYSWWEFLQFAQLPYQYFSDAYVMANSTWFDGLPEDVQALLVEVGEEIGMISTDKIMQVGEDTLAEFEAQGGTVTKLEGDAKAEFDTMMTEKVMPAMADLFEQSALEAAQAFAAQ